MSSFEIENVKDFLKTKNIVWDGIIYDPWLMRRSIATVKFFKNDRMVRLCVKNQQKTKEYIQRVIVSAKKFQIENEKLHQLNNFEDFSEEWKDFLDSKTTLEENINSTINDI